jgi:transposase InsO family protein
MAWKAQDLMSLRQEFVDRAGGEGVNFRALCREYRISPKTGYKWLGRYRNAGPEGLSERSRRPRATPRRTPPEMEALVLAARTDHPAWGGRKLAAYLRNRGHEGVPSPSTVTAILRRHGRIAPRKRGASAPGGRFARDQPNELWQMDFKGHFPLDGGGRCHALTVLDDHSRFLIGVWACADEREGTVRACLEDAFRRFGLPQRVLCDNGSPWGDAADSPHTVLTVWLLRLGVRVTHGRPGHPQTQGKDERLHRTLGEELLSRRSFGGLSDCQSALDHWRGSYNEERPHEALEDRPPASRYHPSPEPFPEELPPLRYREGDLIRKVDASGKISLRGRAYRVGRGFRGEPVALRPTGDPARIGVYYGEHRVGELRVEGAAR